MSSDHHSADEHSADQHSAADCATSLQRIYEYLDAEITDDARQQILIHLEACPPCGKAYDFEVELRRIVAKGCSAQVPDALKERIRQALENAGADGAPLQ